MFGIEVEQFFALFFGPVRDVPWVERGGRGVGFAGFVVLKGLDFFVELVFDFGVEVVSEIEGGLAVFGHAALEDVVGEVFVPEKGGFFGSELDDLPDELGVVVFAFASDGPIRFPDLLAEGIVVGVLEDGEEGGDLEGEAPFALLSFGFGGFGGGCFGRFG